MNDISPLLGASSRISDLSFDMLPIERIVVPDDLYDERTPFDRDTLALFMPIIVWKYNESFSIIDGCKRYRVLATSRKKCCACGIINQQMDEKQAGFLRIRLNHGRGMHAREKLFFIRWLRANCERQVYHNIASTLPMTPSERHDYEKLLGCCDQLTEAVLQGVVNSAVAPEMTHLSHKEAQALINLFAQVSFSRQTQRELAEWLYEIAFIKKNSIESLLSSPEIIAILSQETLNAPQKAARFHEKVFSLRFPLYAAAKKAWTENARRMNPDPRIISFHAAPFFERNTLEVRVKARSPEEGRRSMRELADLDTAAWDMLINPVSHQ